MEDAMDQLEEARDVALLRSAKYQQAFRCYHHHRVRQRAFNVGDLVLRRLEHRTATPFLPLVPLDVKIAL